MSRAPAIVLFDLGDVVARWDPAPRLAEYARRSGLTAEVVRARLATDHFWQETDTGRYSADEMKARICDLLGCRFTRAELLRLQAAAFTVRPEVLRIAERAASHSRVGILTNNAPLLREAVPVHLPELPRVFDPILYSFELGFTKPAPGLYERVTARLGLPPAEIFFIDDQESHVVAARAAGWRAVRYESPAQLEQLLDWLEPAPIDIAEEPMSRLDEHAGISCAFQVERVLEVTPEGLRERALDAPWTKDYDALPGNHPRDWRAHYPAEAWRLLCARIEGRRAGGAVLVLLSGARRALLHDLRVSAEHRGRGIGMRLVRAAEELARVSHFAELAIETQNVNVAACRLYERSGYALASVEPGVYVGLPSEVRLVWRKTL